MELSLAIPGVLIILFFPFLFYYFSFSESANTKQINTTAPPQAGGAWPFIGHLHLMSRGSSDKLPHITLGALADKYGPIFTIRLGARRAVVVSGAELAKQLFTTCDVAVASRPELAGPRHLGYDMAMFGFSPYGPYWRAVRKLISTELLSARRLELEKHVLVSETARSMSELYEAWAREEGPVVVEMKEWFGNLNLNVVVRMVVGKRCFGSGGDDEARRCRRVMRDFFELAGVFVAGDALPYFRWLDIGGFEKKMKETSRELDLLVGQWLEEHKERDQSSDKREEEDFMDVMLSLLHDDDAQNAAANQDWRTSIQSQYDTDTIIKSTCSNLISGASDTTTVMLVWALSLLLNNKHVLRKAQQELDHHVGKQRRVNTSDISKLTYLQAIVKETLRLYPAAPLGGLREFTEDCSIGGYHIQKGTQLFVNLWKLHRNPHVWPDPSEFRPERFLATHKDVDVRGRDFELIPFGSGRRICPGVHFALHMLHLVLANLLQGFEFWTPSGELVDMTQSGGLTNGKATPLHVLISPRLPHALY